MKYVLATLENNMLFRFTDFGNPDFSESETKLKKYCLLNVKFP